MESNYLIRLLPNFWFLFTLLFMPTMILAAPLNLKTHESNGFSYQTGSKPRWISPMEYAQPKVPSDEIVDYLLIDNQAKMSDTNANYFYRQVSQPKTTEGLEQVSRIEVEFNPAYQKLILHDISIVRNNEILDKLQTKNITLLQREESLDKEIVDGYVTALIVISDTRKEDIIDFSYSVIGRNPIYGQHIFYGTSMGWSVPAEAVRTRFIYQGKQKIYYQAHKLDQKPKITKTKNAIEYEWLVDNSKATYAENDTPSWYRMYPSVNLSSFENWQKVSDWAEPLYSNQTLSHPELVAFVDSLKGLPKKEQIKKALEFTQDEIRYLGVELGINSHKPHNPDEVFTKRFGDCKDKTLLLISILKELGISAHPALVATFGNSELDQLLPTPSKFNHVITRVELDKKVYWLDPTRNLQTGKLDKIGYRSFDKALVIGHPDVNIETMPKATKEIPEVNIEEHFNILAYSAPVDYQITTLFTGIEAEVMRSRLASKGKAVMSRNYLDFMTRIYPGIELVKPINFKKDHENNTLIVKENYRINNYFREEQGSLAFDTYAFWIADYVNLPNTVNRQSPMQHFEPVRLTHKTYIHYPEYFNMSLTNNIPAISTPNFEFSVEEDYQDKAIIVTTKYEVKNNFIPKEQVKEHISQLREAKKNISQSYVVNTPENPLFDQRMASFVKELNDQMEQLEGVDL